MILKVTLTHTATETYESIFNQIVSKFGLAAAKKFERKALQTLKTLSKTPYIFKSIEGNSDVRKGYINKNCSFFYQVSVFEVSILFFWDNRQEPLFH